MTATTPTGKTHMLVTLQDVLNLEPDELLRMLPDLVAWHSATREEAIVIGIPVCDMGAQMEWIDDGECVIRSVKVNLGEHGVIDLLQLAANQEQPSRAPEATRPILQVTPSQAEAEIASEHYYTGNQGSYAVWQKTDEMEPPDFMPLRGLMHCALVCKNGHVVTGEAPCQDLRNQNPERAKESARRRAFEKLYDMVVYAERDRLSKTTQ